MTVGLILTFAMPLTVSHFGPLDWGTIFCGYIGLFFLCAANLAVGLLASAITNRQIIAFILGFCGCFGLFVIGESANVLPEPIGSLAQKLSFKQRFTAVTTGVLDLRDLFYFFSVCLLCLGGAAEVLHSRYWRR